MCLAPANHKAVYSSNGAYGWSQINPQFVKWNSNISFLFTFNLSLFGFSKPSHCLPFLQPFKVTSVYNLSAYTHLLSPCSPAVSVNKKINSNTTAGLYTTIVSPSLLWIEGIWLTVQCCNLILFEFEHASVDIWYNDTAMPFMLFHIVVNLSLQISRFFEIRILFHINTFLAVEVLLVCN